MSMLGRGPRKGGRNITDSSMNVIRNVILHNHTYLSHMMEVCMLMGIWTTTGVVSASLKYMYVPIP